MQKTYHREEKDKKRQGFDLKNSDEENIIQRIFIMKKYKEINHFKGDRNLKRVT